MKLRTTSNSIRIRIRKSELTTLNTAGLIEEHIRIGETVTFSFAIQIDKSSGQIEASLKDNYLLVRLPELAAQQWIGTNQVGIENNYAVSPSETLSILIEKDFPCPDRPGENKEDTFWEIASKEKDQC